MRGLYIHIPFCVQKCSYCDFYSLPNRLNSVESYIQALLVEAEKYRGLSFQTLYFGGGTPSILGVHQLKSLMSGLQEYFKFYKNTCSGGDDKVNGVCFEATIEVNPDSATRKFLSGTREYGFNRISVGVQSLSDAELRSVGRIHNAKQAIDAIKVASATGFTNISADLIIGLPGQTWQTLRHSIKMLLDLNIVHFSIYCLSLETATPIAENPPQNLPSDEAQVALFEKARSLLTSKGFLHYEISNFALPGYESHHNTNYWRAGEFLGLGTAAASHLDGVRFKNKPDLDAYLKRPTAQMASVDELDIIHKAREEAMLRLRLLNEGITVSEFTRKFKVEITKAILNTIGNMKAAGELNFDGKKYTLNPAHIMTSNVTLAKLFV